MQRGMNQMGEPNWMLSPMVKFADKQADDAKKDYEEAEKELKKKKKTYEDVLRIANDAGLVALFVVGVASFVSNLRKELGASKLQMIAMEVIASVAFALYLAARFLYTGRPFRTFLVLGNWALSTLLAMAMTMQHPMKAVYLVPIPFFVVVIACGLGLWYETHRVKKYEKDCVRLKTAMDSASANAFSLTLYAAEQKHIAALSDAERNLKRSESDSSLLAPVNIIDMSQYLELVLNLFLMSDNDARRQAEDLIKRLAKDPQVVPALVHHLRTAETPNVRQLAAVLLRKKITGHWAKLSPQLRQLVKQSLTESITMEHSPPVRRASANVVSIIAKYAVPGGEWPDLIYFLFQWSQSRQEDHREVALILFSLLTETIGDSLRPYFANIQKILLECLQDETSNGVRMAALKAVGSFIEFTHDANEVVQYLPHVVPLAFASCNLDDGYAIDIDDENGFGGVSSADENGLGGVSSDDEARDEPRVRNISIRTGVLDEKVAATQALGLFGLHTKSAFAPYLEESLRILVKHASYVHEDVRLQAITALKNMLTAAHAVFQSQSDGATKEKETLDSVMSIYIKTMNEDKDKAVVAQACMCVADIIKDIGYATIEPYMTQIVESTLRLLKEESVCQLTESDSDVEVLMDAVSDLLPAFAKAMGPHFAPFFSDLFYPLMEFAKGSRPAQDRTMVVACLAEVAQDMGAPIAAYADGVMPLVLEELSSSSSTNRQNAAFCAGELCKNGGVSSLKYFGDVLHGLYPLFGESEPDLAVRDNAAGAVARMIMAHQDSVPLNQVLPVFVKALPLKEDHEESMPVYSCICNLVLSSNPQIAPLVPDLVNVFAQVALSPLETPEVKVQIGRAFAHLLSKNGQQMQPLLSNLPPALANALAAIAPKS